MSFFNYSNDNDNSFKQNKFNSKSDKNQKNKNFYPQKKISSLLEIEMLSNNLSKIIDLYFTSQNLIKEQQIFNEKYKYFQNNHNVLILLLMHDFPNFNIFDYLHLKIDNNRGIDQSLIREQKLMIIVRNNIILTLLIVANQLHEFEIQGEISFDVNSKDESEENTSLFFDLSFLNKLLKEFKKKLTQYDNIYNIEYDVEILFLSLLGLNELAQSIKQKHYEYFSNLLYECNLNDINFDTFINETIEKSIYDSLETNELILFRRILNNAARRNFYFGFVFLLHHVEFCYIVSEGRIWKNIGKKMSFENIFNLWELYNEKLNEINEMPQKETLSIEYTKKIDEIIQRKRLYQYTCRLRNNFNACIYKSNSDSHLIDNPKLELNKSYFINENLLSKKDKMFQNFKNMMDKADYDIKKLKDEIELSFVKNLEDLLVIFFKNDLKELVMDFLDRIYSKNNKNYLFPTKILEICLNYDEDISIDILNKSIIDYKNTKYYMQICIIKKYFRLARRLLKYKESKEYLNTPPPKNENYINWLSKIQIFSKKKIINSILYKHPKTNITLINLIKAVENQDILINELDYDIYQNKKNSFLNLNDDENNSSFNNSFASNNYSYKNYFINSQTNKSKTSVKLISADKIKRTKSLKFFFNKEKDNYSYRNLNNNTTNSQNLLLNDFNNNKLMLLNKRKSFDKFNIENSNFFNKIKKFKISSFFNKKQKNTNTKISNSSQKFPKNLILNVEDRILNFIIKRKKSNNIDNNNNNNNKNDQIPMIKVLGPKTKTVIHNSNIAKNLLNSSNKNYSRRNRVFVPKNDDTNSKKISFNASPLNVNIYKQNSDYISLIKKIKTNKIKKYQKNILFPNEKNNENKKTNLLLRENEIKNNNSNVKISPIKKTKVNRSKSLKICSNYKKNLSIEKFDELNIENIKKGKFNINVQIVLIEQLRNPEFVVDILCLLNEIKETKFLIKNASKIIRHLLVFIKSEEYITKCKEPLLFIALSAEFLMKLGNLDKKHFDRCKTFADEILELGANLITSLNDEEMLNFFLKEQFDSKNRNSLEIFAENQFYKILNDNNVGNVCEKLWYGEEHQNIINYLRLTQILFSDLYYEDYYNIIQNNYNNNNKINYSFQYEKYNNNCSIRFYIDSVFIILIAFLFEMVIYKFISKYYDDDKSNNYEFNLTDYLGLFFIFTYILNYLFLCIFIYKTDRIINFDKFESSLVLILFIILIIIMFNIPSKIFQDSSVNNLIYSILLSIVLLILWLKVFIILSVTYTYGPFIRILFNIFDQFFCFMVIFICVTFCFAQIFSIFFKNSNKDFILFYESFLSLFNTAFGQVYFDNFTIMTVFGYVFLILFSTFSNIIMFNLIVSILNNFYNDCEEIADAQSRAMLVLNHEKLRWNGSFDLLIFLPVPFNIFSFPFCVYLLFIKDVKKREKLNEFYCRKFFVVIAFILFVVLLLFGIIIYPFALIKSYYHSFYDINNKDYLNLKRSKILNKNSEMSKSTTMKKEEIDFIKKMTKKKLILDFIFRPFKLVFYLYEDLINYWKLIYKKEKNNKKNKIIINKEFIIELRKTFCDLYFKERKKIITMYDLYKILYLNKKPKIKQENNTFSSNEIKNENISIYSKLSNNSKKLFYDLYKDNSKNNLIYQDEMKDILNIIQNNGPNFIENFNKHLYNTLNFSYIKKNKFLNHAVKVFKILIYKLSNPEGHIDIERALAILPYRVKYNKEYLNSLYYLNLRALIKGFRKFLFINEKNNFIFSFKKLQLIVYKLMIKMELMFIYFPNEIKENVNNHFYSLNNEFNYCKKFFDKMFEKKEQESEYNDEGNEEDYFNLKVQKIISDVNKKCSYYNEQICYENSTTSVYSNLSNE